MEPKEVKCEKCGDHGDFLVTIPGLNLDEPLLITCECKSKKETVIHKTIGECIKKLLPNLKNLKDR